ncbi:MAG: hypothetical protein HKN35_15960 [Woeseia sp.]|nr:hypothetical protein [Woeseia sp.]
MKLIVRVQKHLVVAHRACDGGDWVFTLCRRGFEEAVGRRLKTGETVVADLSATILEQENQ